MNINEPAASCLRAIATLPGDRVGRVIYHELKYTDDRPFYREPDHDSLDFGLELVLESGRTFSFIWKWPVSYYLAVLVGDLSSELTGEHASWDVSGESPWESILTRDICAAHLEWFQDDEDPGDFPITVKLVVAPSTPIYITLGVGDEPDDQVSVLFSDDVARSYGRSITMSSARGGCNLPGV